MDQITVDLSGHQVILVNPYIHVNTGQAFAGLTLNPENSNLPSLKDIIKQPIFTWQNQLKNDFEEPVFKLYPAIKEIKESLYKIGALYASMSGSGSTVYGIFKKELHPQINFNSTYSVSKHSL